MFRLLVLTTLLSAASAQAAGQMVIVVGAEGETEFGRQFATWSDRWTRAGADASLGVTQIGRDAVAASQPTTQPATPGARQPDVVRVASTNTPVTTPATTPTTMPASDKDKLQAVLRDSASSPDDPLWLVLIGHGTSDGREAKFNLRGPDVSDKELAEWLRPLRRPVAIVNCASSSGTWVNRLSAKNRVVITATRTGSELQFARFGDYVSAAVVDAAADLDKDGQTSLLEAFVFASKSTDAFYKQAGRIVTEHALLDDNADGLGVSADWFAGVRPARAAKAGAAVDGPGAHRWFLSPSHDERGLTPQGKARRDALEASIETLRAKKATMAEAEYYAQLEKIMTELATIYGQ